MSTVNSCPDNSPQSKRAQLTQQLQQRAAKSLRYAATTVGQQALWVLHSSFPENAAYNIAFCARIEGNLNVDALKRALQALVQRHSALRARFVFRDGHLQQEIAGFRELPWQEIYASTLSDSALNERIQRDHKRPFKLGHEIPIRARLYRSNETRHVLLIDIHHIAFDAWSMWITADELFKLYERESGRGQPLPPLVARFEDYAQEQQQRWSGPAGDQQLAFWRKRLEGIVQPVAFPSIRARGDDATPQGASYFFTVNAALCHQAKQLAAQLSITPFTLYLGVMFVALQRYTGQEDLTLGFPSSGREQPSYQGVVGYFVNPVLLRAQVVDHRSFKQLAEHLRLQVMDSLAHQEYPYVKLVEQLKVPKEPGRTPLFQVLFNYYRPQSLAQSLDDAMTCEGWPLGDLRVFQCPIHQQEGQFEIALDFLDTGTQVQGVLRYRSDLYDEPYISTLSQHYVNLLKAIVANPDLPLSQLAMLDAGEQQQIIVDWNSTTQEPVPSGRLFDPFLAQAARTPDAIALIHGSVQLSYQDVLQRASGFAHQLQASGVVPESCVAICLERSIEMLVAVLGVQLAGGAYVPLDASSPNERLLGIIEQCRAQVLVTRSARATELAGAASHTFSIDSLAAIEPSTLLPSCDAKPDNLAYIIFTSGSTGTPKGVMIEHRSALNTVLDINQRYGVNAEDTLIGLSSLGFDLSVYDIFGALAAGATLVIPDHGRAAEPDHWLNLLQNHQVTVWNSAPIMMEMLVAKLRLSHRALPAALRLVMMSGDWIPVGLPDQIRLHSQGNPTLISLGGATEAAIWSIGFPIDVIHPDWKSIPYGKPLARQRFHVLDSQLNPVPVGVVGELYIGGVGVARGYLGRADLTQERFIPDPFGSANDRLYRTGDIGRYLPCGNIEFMGRIDSQVKIRGYRVELGEIEACLSRIPEVAEAVVVAREIHAGIKDLVGYIVPRHSQCAPRTADLQDRLRQSLPEYMVPVAFVNIDHFPMTANGKLNRDALPLPQWNASALDKTSVAPRNELEQLLCQLWGKTLKVESVGIHDSFFDLGGQSLLAVTLLANIGQALARELTLDALLHAPTVAEMAEWLQQDDKGSEILARMRKGDGQAPLFCIHPVGGNILAYRELTERLAPGYAIYGIRSLGLRTGETRVLDLTRMAEIYLQEIRKVCPTGPYRLLGWSLGGIIALEIASRLEAQGETVELLTLIDSYAQETGGKAVSEAELLAWMAVDIAGMTGVTTPINVHDLGTGPEARDQFIRRAIEIGALPQDTPIQQLRQMMAVLDGNLRAMFEHQPKVYRGRVLQIHACHAPSHHPAHPAYGWKPYITNMALHAVEGEHYTLLQTPHVASVATLIDEYLQQTVSAHRLDTQEILAEA
ncbi:MAG: amino acid adenylation domain-containing protein [Marinagarivorans sp.]|nr:amino acid adenylation domain-containing protein [Marinagarivorans sp.]